MYSGCAVGGAGKPRSRRRCAGVAAAALALTLAIGNAAGSNAAELPYEPNDSTLSATGPLEAGASRIAALETYGDRDFFYFYVTSPQMPRVELTISNLGGGRASDIELTIFDSAATPLASQGFIRDGEARTVTVSLEPQKYFAEVTSAEGSGDAYSLSAGGEPGAFGTYAQIAERCERATAAASAAQAGLGKRKQSCSGLRLGFGAAATGRLGRAAGPMPHTERRGPGSKPRGRRCARRADREGRGARSPSKRRGAPAPVGGSARRRPRRGPRRVRRHDGGGRVDPAR